MSPQPRKVTHDYAIVDKPIVKVTSPHLRLFDAIAAEFLVTSHTDRMRLANGGRVEWNGLGNVARSIIEKETYLTEVPRAAVWWVTRGRSYSGGMSALGLRAMAMGWSDLVVVDRLVEDGAELNSVGIPPFSARTIPFSDLVTGGDLIKPPRFTCIHYQRAKHIDRKMSPDRPSSPVMCCVKDDGMIELLLEETAKRIELPRALAKSLHDGFEPIIQASFAEPIQVAMDACQEKGDFLTSEMCRLLGDSLDEYPCYLDCPSRGRPWIVIDSSGQRGQRTLLETMRCDRHRYVRWYGA